MFCKWMKEWRNMLWNEWMCWLLKLNGNGLLESMEAQGMCRDLTKKEGKWNRKRLEEKRTEILTWTGLSCTVGQLAVSYRLADMSTSVDQQPTEFNSVPLPAACFVTGNRQSAVGQPTCTASVDRQPTEWSSVSFPEWWIFCQETWRLAVGQWAVCQQPPTRLADRQPRADRVFKIDLFVRVSWDWKPEYD